MYFHSTVNTEISSEMRRNEKIDLRKTGLAQSLTIAFGSVVPVVAAIFTFLGLILSGGNLLAGDVSLFRGTVLS